MNGKVWGGMLILLAFLLVLNLVVPSGFNSFFLQPANAQQTSSSAKYAETWKATKIAVTTAQLTGSSNWNTYWWYWSWYYYYQGGAQESLSYTIVGPDDLSKVVASKLSVGGIYSGGSWSPAHAVVTEWEVSGTIEK